MEKPRRRPPGRPRFDDQEAPIAETIMKTATSLFMEFGYEGVSVDQVAQECGVTKATVYYHYQNKASLFTQAIVDLMNRIRLHTVKVLEQDVPLLDRLTRIAELRLSVPGSIHDFESMMSEAEAMLNEEQMGAMRAAEMRIARVLADEFQKSIVQGELRPMNPMFAAHAYLSLLMVGKGKDETGNLLFESPLDAATSIVSLLWDGLRSFGAEHSDTLVQQAIFRESESRE